MTPEITSNKRILLVEDEQSVRQAYNMLLSLDGHLVTEAENGIEGLSCFSASKFDLIITDFEMPKMKGDEFAAKVKQLLPGQPILMITAYSVGREVQVDAVLNKPFTLQELRQAIGKAIRST